MGINFRGTLGEVRSAAYGERTKAFVSLAVRLDLIVRYLTGLTGQWDESVITCS